MRLYAAVMTVVPDRALVRMTGPDAVAHLQSMVSNDVEAIPAGGGAYALLLTPKARVIADLEVYPGPQRRSRISRDRRRRRFRL